MRTKRTRTPEAVVLDACLQLLKLRGVFCWRSNNSAIRRTDTATGRQWMQFSGLRGVSDILGILRPSGRLLAVEAKSDVGTLTAEQELFLDAVRTGGGCAVVVYGVKDLQALETAIEGTP